MDGFTVVRCGTCAQMPSGFDEAAAALPGVDEVLVEGLRAVVRDSRHGVLVSGGCRSGRVAAPARPAWSCSSSPATPTGRRPAR